MCPTTKFICVWYRSHLESPYVCVLPQNSGHNARFFNEKAHGSSAPRTNTKKHENRDILRHLIVTEYEMFVHLYHLGTNCFQADQLSKSADTETLLNPLWCWDIFCKHVYVVTTPWRFWKSELISFKLLSAVSFTAVIHMWTLAIMSAGERGTQRT